MPTYPALRLYTFSMLQYVPAAGVGQIQIEELVTRIKPIAGVATAIERAQRLMTGIVRRHANRTSRNKCRISRPSGSSIFCFLTLNCLISFYSAWIRLDSLVLIAEAAFGWSNPTTCSLLFFMVLLYLCTVPYSYQQPLEQQQTRIRRMACSIPTNGSICFKKFPQRSDQS